jgi:hypothetical protein
MFLATAHGIWRMKKGIKVAMKTGRRPISSLMGAQSMAVEMSGVSDLLLLASET